jgi:hypothetical protein
MEAGRRAGGATVDRCDRASVSTDDRRTRWCQRRRSGLTAETVESPLRFGAIPGPAAGRWQQMRLGVEAVVAEDVGHLRRAGEARGTRDPGTDGDDVAGLSTT